MSGFLKVVFLLQAILAVLVGAPLLLAPGRFLDLIGWAPVDPLLSRLLGAALLAMAWTSIYALRTSQRERISILIQMQLIFCVLGMLGFLRHLLTGFYYPPMVWGVTIVLAAFSLAWGLALIRNR